MTTKHTPGPWKITRNVTPGQFGTDTKIRDSRDGVIAVMHVNADANAHLLAAAPDLYEALKRSRAQWIHSVNAEFCLAAIAKAEGQQ